MQPRRLLSSDEQDKLDESLQVCWRRKIALAVVLSLIAITVGFFYGDT